MRPLENFRVKVMSMAFFMAHDQPAVWRGPMVNSAFDRMAIGSEWGKLDVMIVDMPPGKLFLLVGVMTYRHDCDWNLRLGTLFVSMRGTKRIPIHACTWLL